MLPLPPRSFCNLLHPVSPAFTLLPVETAEMPLSRQSVQAEMMLIITTPASAADLQRQQDRPDQQARTGWHHSLGYALLNLADRVAAS